MTPNRPQFRERYESRDGKDLRVVRPVVNKTSTNYFLGCCILVTVCVNNPSRPGRVSGGGNMNLSIPLVTRSKCNVALLFVLLIGLINHNSHQASAQTGEGLLAVHMHIHFTTTQS